MKWERVRLGGFGYELGPVVVRSDELEALGDRLSVFDIVLLSRVSHGWRHACLTWLSSLALRVPPCCDRWR